MTEVSFGEWLKRQRMGKGLTREQLAHQVGCAAVTLRKIEAEERHPSVQIVERLAEIFNIPPNEQSNFLKYARGDWAKAPSESIEEKPWRAPIFPRTNLPTPLTSFIGRENDIAGVKEKLARHRLVTLMGPGGIGKTRLSLKIGEELSKKYANGVWFVELASILDPVLVPRTVAIAIGLRGEPQRPVIDMLSDYLREKKTLLILDNCEHLLEACAQLSDALLKNCPHLNILATSREALGILGEVIYRLSPLRLPDIRQLLEQFRACESVRLFEERAQLVQMDFLLTLENAASVAQICICLDGIPLAIELAAARVNMFSTEQIAARLRESLNLLATGNRTALPRHQTLHAAIDWSYKLLSSAEQILFRRLSVFVGGWTLEAAESVGRDESVSGLMRSEDVLNVMEHLINKSMILAEVTQAETRYRLLETIRQYANEKLVESGESNTLRYRHLDYFLDLAEQADQEQYGQTRDQWSDRIEQDDDNFRAALEWCLSGKSTESALRLFGAWAPQGYHRFSEFHSWFDKIQALPNVMNFPALYARLLNDAAGKSWLLGNDYYAKSLIEESQAIWLNLGADGELGLAEAWVILGEIALREKDMKSAQSLFEQSLALYQKHGNERGSARVIFGFGHKALDEENYAKAEEQFKKCLAIWKDLGAEFDVPGAYAYNELGLAAQMQGDYERAGEYYEQCIKILRKRRSPVLFKPLLNSAWVFLRAGDDQNARLRYEEGLKLCREQGDNNDMIFCLAGFACVLGIRRKFEEAARLFGAFESLLEGSKSQLDISDRKEIDHYLSVVRTQLDEATWAKAWAEGCELILEQAIAYALEELGV